MWNDIKQGSILFARFLIKGAIGFVVVPLGILISEIKPNWEEASRSVKVGAAIFVFPAVVFLLLVAPWWEDFDIEG